MANKIVKNRKATTVQSPKVRGFALEAPELAIWKGVLALLRGRGHVAAEDMRDLAADVLRHRLVLSYDALSENISADDILDRVLAAVEVPPSDHLRRRVAAA